MHHVCIADNFVARGDCRFDSAMKRPAAKEENPQRCDALPECGHCAAAGKRRKVRTTCVREGEVIFSCYGLARGVNQHARLNAFRQLQETDEVEPDDVADVGGTLPNKILDDKLVKAKVLCRIWPQSWKCRCREWSFSTLWAL